MQLPTTSTLLFDANISYNVRSYHTWSVKYQAESLRNAPKQFSLCQQESKIIVVSKSTIISTSVKAASIHLPNDDEIDLDTYGLTRIVGCPKTQYSTCKEVPPYCEPDQNLLSNSSQAVTLSSRLQKAFSSMVFMQNEA